MKKKLGEKGSSKELSTSIGNPLPPNSRGLGFKSQWGIKIFLSPFWVAISRLLFTSELINEYAKWSISDKFIISGFQLDCII